MTPFITTTKKNHLGTSPDKEGKRTFLEGQISRIIGSQRRFGEVSEKQKCYFRYWFVREYVIEVDRAEGSFKWVTKMPSMNWKRKPDLEAEADNLRYLAGGTGGSQFKVCVSSRELKTSVENLVSLNISEEQWGYKVVIGHVWGIGFNFQ